MYRYMCGSVFVFGIRIRIHKAPKYGSNTNPDPQHWKRQTRQTQKMDSTNKLAVPAPSIFEKSRIRNAQF